MSPGVTNRALHTLSQILTAVLLIFAYREILGEDKKLKKFGIKWLKLQTIWNIISIYSFSFDNSF